MSSVKYARIVTPATGCAVVGGGFNNPINYLHFTANPSQPTFAASGGQGPLVWNPSPDIRAGFPEFNTSQWINSNSWQPGRVGLYTISWSFHSGNTANEVCIVKNQTITSGSIPGYSSSAMIGLANANEGSICVPFYSASNTDYISFGVYNAASGSVTVNAPRNYLTITREA